MDDPKQACLVLAIGPRTTIESFAASWCVALAADVVVLVEQHVVPGLLALAISSAVEGDLRVRRVRWEGFVPRLRDVWEVGAGDWVVVVADGYALAADALPVLLGRDADAVYGDETTALGPYHKPAWSLDLALEQDLVGGVCAVRAGTLAGLGPVPFEPPHDLVLRLGAAARVAHVPCLLSSTAGLRREGPGEAAVAAVLEGWAGSGVVGRLVPSATRQGRLRVAWRAAVAPTVSVVIPIRDRPALLEQCVAGLLERTDYPALELVIADNDSVEAETAAVLAQLAADPRFRIVPVPGPFNYAHINNVAVAASSGDVVLLLNNDVEVMEPGWLAEMVGLAMRPGVGAVGAKLLYPDGTIQHGGVMLGIGTFEGGPGIAGHYGYGGGRSEPGYADQLVIARGMSAVTGACLALRRTVWDAVGGLNAVDLTVALNDVDLCLRVREAGLEVVWTPHAVLLHHESASRGSDQAPGTRERFRRECRYLRDRWGAVLDDDPFYNRHFSRSDHRFRVGP